MIVKHVELCHLLVSASVKLAFCQCVCPAALGDCVELIQLYWCMSAKTTWSPIENLSSIDPLCNGLFVFVFSVAVHVHPIWCPPWIMNPTVHTICQHSCFPFSVFPLSVDQLFIIFSISPDLCPWEPYALGEYVMLKTSHFRQAINITFCLFDSYHFLILNQHRAQACPVCSSFTRIVIIC